MKFESFISWVSLKSVHMVDLQIWVPFFYKFMLKWALNFLETHEQLVENKGKTEVDYFYN